ncbi:hypothetical protein RLOC_00001089 [Lonchura striata]|uniref:Uncharacterized protein n=1 Tax=Lonchura striata TaxID=40157 RepID=A0A218UXC6_9PASE|nr:hypothetical protein RLOC_00001089 [Lonchura striata domestica]
MKQVIRSQGWHALVLQDVLQLLLFPRDGCIPVRPSRGGKGLKTEDEMLYFTQLPSGRTCKGSHLN